MLINKNIEINETSDFISGVEIENFFIPNKTNKSLNNIILPVYSFEIKTNSICILTDVIKEFFNSGKIYLYDGYKYEKLEIKDISNIYIRVNKTANLITLLNSLSEKYIVIILNDIFIENKRIIEIKNEIIFDNNIYTYTESYLGLKYKDTWPFNKIGGDAYYINKNNSLGIKKIETDENYKNLIIYTKYKNNTDNDLFDLKTTIYRENKNLNNNYNKIVGVDLFNGKLIKNLVGDEIEIGEIKKIKIKNNNIFLNNFLKTCIKINNKRYYNFHKIRGKLKKVFILNKGSDYEENPNYKIIPNKIDFRYKEPKLKFIVKNGEIVDCIIKDPGDYIIGDIDIIVYNKNNIPTATLKGLIEGYIFDIDYNVFTDKYEKIKELSFEYGSGAVLNPIIIDGKIVSVNIINPGKGYFNTPKIEIISDGGTGAFLYVNSIYPDGGIQSISIISSGVGYDENKTKINLINLNIGDIIDDIQLNKYNLIYTGVDDKYSQIIPNFNTTSHGELIGVSLDGFPIYIGVGYSDPLDSNSPLKILTPSYHTDTTQIPSNNLVQKYIFNNSGDLDEYNGRFCVTPEFPDGIYAYFITQDPPFYPLKLKYFVKELNSAIPVFKNNKIDKKIDFSYKNKTEIKRINIPDNTLLRVGDFINFTSNKNNYSYGEVSKTLVKDIYYDFYKDNIIKTNKLDFVKNKYLLKVNSNPACPIRTKIENNKIYILDGAVVEEEYINFCDNIGFIVQSDISQLEYKNFIIFYNGVIQIPESIIILYNNNNLIIKNNYDKIYVVDSVNLYLQDINTITNIIPKLNYNDEILFINGIIQKNYNKTSSSIILSENLYPGDKIQIYYFDYNVLRSNNFDSNGYLLDYSNNLINTPGFVFYHFINGVFSNNEIYFDGIGYKLNNYINYMGEDNYFVGINYSGVIIPNDSNCVNRDFILFFINNVLQNKEINLELIKINDEYKILPKDIKKLDSYYFIYIKNTIRVDFDIIGETNIINTEYDNFILFVNGIIQTDFLYNSTNKEIYFYDNLSTGDKITLFYVFNNVYYNLLYDNNDNYIKYTDYTIFDVLDYNFLIIVNGVIQKRDTYDIIYDGTGYKLINNFLSPEDEIKIIAIKDLIFNNINIIPNKKTKFYLYDENCNPVLNDIIVFINGVHQKNIIYDVDNFYINEEIKENDVIIIYKLENFQQEEVINYTGNIPNNSLTFINGIIQNPGNFCLNENIYKIIPQNSIIWNLSIVGDEIYDNYTNAPFDLPDYGFMIFINNVIQNVEIKFINNKYKIIGGINYDQINDTLLIAGIKNLSKIEVKLNNSYLDLNREKIIYILRPHKLYFKKPVNFKSSCYFEETSQFFIVDSNKNIPGVYDVFLDGINILLSISNPPVYILSERIEEDKILLYKKIIPNNKKYFKIDLINLSNKSISGGSSYVNILNKQLDILIEDSSHSNIWIDYIDNNDIKVVRKYFNNKILPTNIPIYYYGCTYVKISIDLEYLDIIEFYYDNNTIQATVLDTRFKKINIYGIKINEDIIIDKNKIQNVTKIN